jgi:hypothetical protein
MKFSLEEIYDDYLRFCARVGHTTPPSFEFWKLLTTK